MELTRQERKLAEVAARNYHRFYYRKSETIGWIGVPIFALGILPFLSLPSWLDKTFLFLGFLLIILGGTGTLMSALGKLQKRVHELELGNKEDDKEN